MQVELLIRIKAIRLKGEEAMKKVVAVFLLIVLILVLWGAYVAYAVMTITPVLTAKWGNVSEENVEVVVDADL
jgi:cell division septal protein FtsQ